MIAAGLYPVDSKRAKELNGTLWGIIDAGQIDRAFDCLAPVLGQAVPFRLLDILATPPGPVSPEAMDRFLEKIAATRAMGGWVIIASALKSQIALDLAGCLSNARRTICCADAWCATDIIGERVPGPALLHTFQNALSALAPWRVDENRWVRRSVGVAAHFWAKRSRGAPAFILAAHDLLDFLTPLFEERNTDAAKGIGWGLKTLGRYYPDLVLPWLEEQVLQKRRPHRALILRKAITCLPEADKARFMTPPQELQHEG